MAEPVFRRDLYAGTARYYDRFRSAYPDDMIADLIRRADVSAAGRLMDLACGTGQLAFALQDHFGEVWAVDQEPDMTEVVAGKARSAGLASFRVVTSAAETLTAPEDAFDLVTIGNAFHRLRRDAVAARVLRWLRPGRCLALVWADGPSSGAAPWQQAMAATLQWWRDRAGAGDRVPPEWDAARTRRPDQVILAESGFTLEGDYAFPAQRAWTPGELIGWAYSTSFLSPAVLGDLAAGFESDLRGALHDCEPSGTLLESATVRYGLAGKPA